MTRKMKKDLKKTYKGFVGGIKSARKTFANMAAECRPQEQYKALKNVFNEIG